MKKAGIVGGIGPASTLDYYNGIINGCREKTKGNDFPRLIIDSINMNEMLGYLDNKRYAELISVMVHSISCLAAAGAEFAAIASNTPHIVFEEIEKRSELPLISIVEETCKYAKSMNCGKVVIMGTRFTMSSGMFEKAFKRYGIEPVTLDADSQNIIHNIIFPNLENGIVIPDDKARMLAIANAFISKNGADALLLGCTEIPLMIKQSDINTQLLNTTQIHIDSIVNRIIS